MSAPIATPQPNASKASRRSGRKPRMSNASNLDGSVTPVAPSADAPQRNPSPSTNNITKNNHKGQPRKLSHATNKLQSDIKQINNHEKGKATPMKPAAYAGATFQQSPAASTLPLPSFYSRSLPTASGMPVRPSPEPLISQTATTTSAEESPSKPEPNPCDFLFEAARLARSTPRADSPATRSGNLSVPNGSPASRSPAPREGDAVFPFELDGATPGEDGSPFATPYKDRMEALRSTSSGGKSMDDDERKAKTEALKKLLMKSSAQENKNDVGGSIEMNNPFNARAPYSKADAWPQGSPQMRASSNPSTPIYAHESRHHHNPNLTPVSYPFPTPQTQTPKRPNSSRLRHVYGAQSEPEYAELSSDSAVTPPSSSRKNTIFHPPPQYNTAIFANHPPAATHRAKPSAQQLEDDLRRVLKLDLTSSG